MLIFQLLVFNAQLVPEDTESTSNITFSDASGNQVFIPANAIRHQRNLEEGTYDILCT